MGVCVCVYGYKHQNDTSFEEKKHFMPGFQIKIKAWFREKIRYLLFLRIKIVMEMVPLGMKCVQIWVCLDYQNIGLDI